MLDLKMRKKRVTVPLGSDGLLHRVLKKKKKRIEEGWIHLIYLRSKSIFVFYFYTAREKNIFYKLYPVGQKTGADCLTAH